MPGFLGADILGIFPDSPHQTDQRLLEEHTKNYGGNEGKITEEKDIPSLFRGSSPE
jgi:hypothetical protein